MDAFKQKPVPKDFTENEIKFKQSNPVKVVDSIQKDYNRQEVLQKLKEHKKDAVIKQGVKPSNKVPSGKQPAKKVNKKLKLKTVKSTITQVEPPKAKTVRLTEQIDKDSQDKSVIVKGSLIDLKRLPVEDTIKLSTNDFI